MSDAQRPMAATEGYLPVYKYRCVCGADVLVDRHSGGDCESCGRTVASTIVQNDASVTIAPLLGQPLSNLVSPALLYESQLGNSETSRTGEVLGHYRIVDALGAGGMGTVYRALDESLQRYVALKVIREPSTSRVDSRHVQRLLQEAIAQARVNHPNIVHIYYVGAEGKSPFFAMELVNGQTMSQRLKAHPLNFAEVVEYAQQIASALKHAADFDILHGDIKPANILINNTNTVKLSDFGLARRLSEITDQPSELSGTPDYLAPESIDGKPMDVRSDLYSLGVTLFEMTFGRVPYADSGSTILQRLAAHQQRSVDFPDPWPRSLPIAWRHVLARLLQKAPENRYPNYDAFLSELAQVKPSSFKMAARVPRAVAWFIDLMLANAAQGLLIAPIAFLIGVYQLQNVPIWKMLLALLACVVPSLAAMLQSYWGKSPGKQLLQLRIVDRHGLPPTKSILFGRAAVQLLPIWAGVAFQILNALGSWYIAITVAISMVIFSVLDAGYACINRKKKSIHDVLFRTRVILDAQSN